MAFIEQPFRPVTADAGLELAEQLERAQEILRHGGVSVPAGNRLQLAARLLRRVYGAGKFASDRRSLLTVGNAIRLAFNAAQIAHALSGGIPVGLRDIVPRFLGGGLEDVGSSAAHHAQTELVVGAICAAGGLKPRVPRPRDGKAPDLVVHARGLDICLEVKRLASSARVEESIREGLKQCVEFGSNYNAIFLDVSDILIPDAATAITDEREALQLARRFAPIWQTASNVLTRRAAEKPYRTALFLGLAADAFVWRIDAKGEVGPAARFFTYQEVFRGAASGLLIDQSHDLRDRFVRGMEELGVKVRQFRPGLADGS